MCVSEGDAVAHGDAVIHSVCLGPVTWDLLYQPQLLSISRYPKMWTNLAERGDARGL